MARTQHRAGVVEGLQVAGQRERLETQSLKGGAKPRGQFSGDSEGRPPPVPGLAIETGEGMGRGHTFQMKAAAEMGTATREQGRECLHGPVGNGQQHPPLRAGLVGQEFGATAPASGQGPPRTAPPQDGEFDDHGTSVTGFGHNGPVEWSLPPQLPWPQFLRLLRHPAPPRGWLEAAAELPEVRKRPLLLRWIAQHRKTPAHLRAGLLPHLPWRALSEIAGDAAAHPQARTLATERLQLLWGSITPGERRSFALHAPKQLWRSVWRVPDGRVIASFLQHPRLGHEALVALIQPPLSPEHAEALARSRWRDLLPVAHQVLWAMDQTFRGPECLLVLGQAAPWIKALPAEERLLAAARLAHPPLRRMTRAWALPGGPDPEGA